MSNLSFSTVNQEMSNNHKVALEQNNKVISKFGVEIAQLDVLTTKIVLPNPSQLEKAKLFNYSKAKNLGVNPILPNPPYGVDYLNISFSNRITHRNNAKNFEYNQKSFEMIYNTNPTSALDNIVSAFSHKESELERGIVINFFAA